MRLLQYLLLGTALAGCDADLQVKTSAAGDCISVDCEKTNTDPQTEASPQTNAETGTSAIQVLARPGRPRLGRMLVPTIGA